MKSKKSYIILVVSIISFGLLLVGGTYAYLSFTANVTNAVYNGATTCFDIDYDITNDDGTLPITGTLFQSSTPKGGLSGKVTMNIKSNCNISEGNGTIKLNVANTTSSLLLSDGALKYAVYENVNSDPVSEGVISATGDMVIYQNFTVTHDLKSYYIYIWLDGNIADNEYVNLPFDGSISASATQINKNEEIPELDDGMIPVKIANNGTVTTVSSTDSTWYNYSNKVWANAVLVKASGTKTRDYYKSNPGTVVSEDDILAYYVWIPRYKYKIWTTSTGSSPQTINIEFENKTAPVSSGTTVGSWRTHPAFIWDGNTVAGIWVGKFETSHSTLSSSTTSNNLSCTDENCTNADGLIIKPNVVSLRRNSVSNQFYASRSMSRSSNPFGFNATTTDTHMMKNSEWGAVAYLSHSEYGINGEIRINNNSSYTTGCGASSANGSSTSSCEIAYAGSSIYPQSTTGNISGVFDMSGGAYEYVMGNYNNTISAARFTTMPASKYYDVYLSTQFTGNYSTNMSLCTIETCGGHALFETAGWYSDYQDFVYADYPWFGRGGFHSHGSSAGVWYSYYYGGNATIRDGFRSVAIVGA